MPTKRWGYKISHVPYSSIVGSFTYVIICTWPNISHAVNLVSRYLSCPSEIHRQAVKWILKYLKSTFDFGLEFGKTGDTLTRYVDSDYAMALIRWGLWLGTSSPLEVV